MQKNIISLVEKISTSAMIRSVRECIVKSMLRAKKENLNKVIVVFASDDGGIHYECANMTFEERLAYLESVKTMIVCERYR